MAVCATGGSKSTKSSVPQDTILPKSSEILGLKKPKVWFCHFFVCKKKNWAKIPNFFFSKKKAKSSVPPGTKKAKSLGFAQTAMEKKPTPWRKFSPKKGDFH